MRHGALGRAVYTLLWAAALAASEGATAQTREGLYARIDRNLSANPRVAFLIGKPAPEMEQVAWIIGEWDVLAVVEGRNGENGDAGVSHIGASLGGVWLEMRDTYPDGNQDLGFLGFNVATSRWTNVSIDGYGNASTVTTERWQGDRLVFEADHSILGVAAHLRQTLERTSKDAFRVKNEERIGGKWVPVDSYVYRRRKPH